VPQVSIFKIFLWLAYRHRDVFANSQMALSIMLRFRSANMSIIKRCFTSCTLPGGFVVECPRFCSQLDWGHGCSLYMHVACFHFIVLVTILCIIAANEDGYAYICSDPCN